MNFDLTDEKGYSNRKDEIDGALLSALAGGAKSYHELQIILFRMGVGDAKSEDRLTLSYSKTGAICRAAVNSLRIRKKIYDSWDTENKRESPFRFYGMAAQ